MNNLLDSINDIKDIKKLKINELEKLSGEIREFLINTVSKTGGHLASNLGVVELTIALHYVFDSPEDKLIWDVGHQSYVHKILTGRKKQMDTIRQFGGLSGFPKRSESEHDVFETGHSSTSISAALGFVNARDIKGEDYSVVSIIGDGALTGGMALEAINNAGRKKSNMIVILNDNEMSISKNVGSISSYLNRVRTGTAYYTAKRGIETAISKIPIVGNSMVRFIRKTKESLKTFLVNGGMLFEEFGFRYIGPIDGHSIDDLIDVLERVKKIEAPVMVHVHTKKGKGYLPAEKKPDVFHGVGKFDVKTGKSLDKSSISFSKVFGSKMVELAEENKNLVAITAAMAGGTGLAEFEKKFPKRFVDVGIAEQHGVTLAAGMASNGMVPVFALYSSFMQRAYDQLVHDVALQNLHVVLCIDRAGIVGRDGETHQGVFDSAFLYQIPNVTVMSPVDASDLENMLEWAVNEGTGPVVIRYPRGYVDSSLPEKREGFGNTEILKEGKDITLVSFGKLVHDAMRASEMLGKEGIEAGVVALKTIKPISRELIIEEGQKTGKILFVDETVKYGSVGRLLYDFLPDGVELRLHTLPDDFIEHGSVEELFAKYKLDGEGISEIVLKWLRNG
ncbi:1-deoxy-D-xylulose-5-phosphate synthase [Dethiosulfatibacter aminovorans DSM 17477]|uniref:1-deoxy-D-xylulose-5-phosphate synthase n=1 Tax=Dethiosulfatibacter aminovorans DSM 17477 TaxID=1121476 RepID=A0A1M6DNX6_9FIRM|nr:1-deoxy-D-xylulose-5-phosphate synthase [Dethiosulfatibacter aminovorans]SHI74921.1 1-deoxy-D-xylulose-5-phosphate synthase [Dethiosulfatibacter aminovorans DSM 17477]